MFTLTVGRSKPQHQGPRVADRTKRSLCFVDDACEDDDEGTEEEIDALNEADEDAAPQLRPRSTRSKKPTRKICEQNATNLQNQRIQIAYIATAERLGGVRRCKPEDIVRVLRVEFPHLKTKDVQVLHRMLKKQSDTRMKEDGKLADETNAELIERWNSPENMDARAFNERWYNRSIRPTCEVCQLELGQDEMMYVQRNLEGDGTYAVADETLRSLYEMVNNAICSHIECTDDKEKRHWQTYEEFWNKRMSSGSHQWVCKKCIQQYELFGDEETRTKRRRTDDDEELGFLSRLPDKASVNHLWPGGIPLALQNLNRTELSMIALINPVISYVCLGGYKGNPQVRY